MYIIALITVGFVLVAYVGYSAADALWLRKARIRRRMDGIAGPAIAQPAASEEEAISALDRMVTSRGMADKLFQMLVRAGVKLKPSEFVAIVAASGLILALLSAVLSKNIYSVLLAMFIGAAIPFVYVSSMQSKRLIAFNRQLPDALSLISSAIRTGYSFPRAMQMVSDEMPAPISEEFTRVISEINVGMALESALHRMTSRIRSYDLELVVTAVTIQQQVGGNLAEIIENIARTIRDRVQVEGEMAVLTAEGRLSGVVLVILPFAIVGVILVLNPSYLLPLVVDPVGKILVVVGICLQILGALVIKKMLVVDY